MITHKILGDKVHVYKRGSGKFWQFSTYLQGRNYRVSTKEESLQHAKQFAEDWYLELRDKARAGLLKYEKTFREVSELFLKEYEVITEGERSPRAPIFSIICDKKNKVFQITDFGGILLRYETQSKVMDKMRCEALDHGYDYGVFYNGEYQGIKPFETVCDIGDGVTSEIIIDFDETWWRFGVEFVDQLSRWSMIYPVIHTRPYTATLRVYNQGKRIYEYEGGGQSARLSDRFMVTKDEITICSRDSLDGRYRCRKKSVMEYTENPENLEY